MEMCSLYLTHPSAHTLGAVDTHTHRHTHTHLGQWAADDAAPGEPSCSRVSPQSWTIPAEAEIRTPQPRVTSPFLHLKTLDILLLIVNISVAYYAFYK